MDVILLSLSWFFCISCVAGQVDQTIVPESRGKYVVDAVVNRIQDSVIFSDDNSLLRRIAYVSRVMARIRVRTVTVTMVEYGN